MKRALHFLENETAFHLGALPTEQSHPLTADLSSWLQADVVEGVRLLFAVDAQLTERLAEVLASEPFAALVGAFTRALTDGRRILFSGCGATGRLCLILEAAWRDAWGTPAPAEASRYRDAVQGMITGGDRALVRSVEGFEDYESFGRRQLRDAGIGSGDVVVAVSEGGETSSVIGSAWQALEQGATVFFVFNNPAAVLRRHVARSRALLEAPGITALDLATGPMAIAGSTRMQAVTMELLVLGLALESALDAIRGGGGDAAAPGAAAARFREQVAAFMAPANLAVLADLVAREAACYEAGGRVTYVADRFFLDIMQDTTERAPTFSLPPFRDRRDRSSRPSWAFIKHPALPTAEAWRAVLGHAPRGLAWTAEDYRALGAAASIVAAPPLLDGSALDAFAIGCEPDPSRHDAADSLALPVEVGAARLCIPPAFRPYLARFAETRRLEIRASGTPAAGAAVSRIVCPLPPSPLCLWERLAVKLALNVLSTATMVRMGYVDGNWMSRAEATNKKLVDRGIRLVAELGKVSYRDACIAFHQTLDAMQNAGADRRNTTAPAMATLQRMGLRPCITEKTS